MTVLSYLVPAGLSLIGGLMGSEEKTVGKTGPTSQTTKSSGSSSHSSSTQNKIDPRMEQAIYGSGGIMPNASAWYAKNSSGLNDQMISGMNNQWNQLGASKQGFDQMQNLGMGLMGGGSAGNPFTGGGNIAAQQLSYKPATMDGSGPFVMPPPMPIPAMSPSYGGGGGGGGGGYGGGYEPVNPLSGDESTAAPAPEPLFDTEGAIIGYSGRSGYRPQDWSNPAPTNNSAYNGSWSGGSNGSGST